MKIQSIVSHMIDIKKNRLLYLIRIIFLTRSYFYKTTSSFFIEIFIVQLLLP